MPNQQPCCDEEVGLLYERTATTLCRICYETQGELVSPCNCSGSSAFVHLPCLKKWVAYSSTPHMCEICHAPWKITLNPVNYLFINGISFLSILLAVFVCTIQDQDLLKTICLVGLFSLQTIIKIVDYRFITMFIFKICFTATWGIVFAYSYIQPESAWSIAFVDFAHWWFMCIILLVNWAEVVV